MADGPGVARFSEPGFVEIGFEFGQPAAKQALRGAFLDRLRRAGTLAKPFQTTAQARVRVVMNRGALQGFLQPKFVVLISRSATQHIAHGRMRKKTWLRAAIRLSVEARPELFGHETALEIRRDQRVGRYASAHEACRSAVRFIFLPAREDEAVGIEIRDVPVEETQQAAVEP